MSRNALRPLISLKGVTVLNNGVPCRVVVRRGIISVGCTDVTIDAARALLMDYDEQHFLRDDPVVIQDGEAAP